jgi:hypothetical protein
MRTRRRREHRDAVRGRHLLAGSALPRRKSPVFADLKLAGQKIEFPIIII